MKHIVLTTLILVATAASAYAQDSTAEAVIVNDANEAIGSATFTQGPIGVLAHIKVEGLPAGVHGMHIHAVGTCDHMDHFKSASGHINTKEKQHGYLNPEGPEEGDMPNLIVGEDGKAEVELFMPQLDIASEGASLMDEDGSSLMIHADPDDHMTQPIGGAGARIACGVIKAKE